MTLALWTNFAQARGILAQAKSQKRKDFFFGFLF